MRFRLTGTGPDNYRVHIDDIDISPALIGVDLSLTAGQPACVTLYVDPTAVTVDVEAYPMVDARPAAVLDTESQGA